MQQVNNKSQAESYDELSLEFDMISQALSRESSMKWLTVTMYQ